MKSKRALCEWEDSGGLRECPDVEKELVRISHIFDFSLTVLVSDTLPSSTRLHLPGHLSQTPSVCLCGAAPSLAKTLPPISLPSNQEFLFWTEPVDCIFQGTRVSQGPGSSPCLPLFSHWLLWSHSTMVGSYLTLSLEWAQVIKSESRDSRLYQHSCNTVLRQFCKVI